MTKRLDVNDPNVFDKWRSLYYDLSEAEQEQFGYDMEEKYPHQASFTPSNFESLFTNQVKIGNSVLEIGGWKGELASQMLAKFPEGISSWTNIDYCKPATEKTVCKDPRYKVIYPHRFHWFKDPVGQTLPPENPVPDICVSAHVIEHLTNEDLASLIEFISPIRTVMFEAPIARDHNDWRGYIGTHILTWGWNQVNAAMAASGYRATEVNPYCFLYEK